LLDLEFFSWIKSLAVFFIFVGFKDLNIKKTQKKESVDDDGWGWRRANSQDWR
jgi:hypothetical protein